MYERMQRTVGFSHRTSWATSTNRINQEANLRNSRGLLTLDGTLSNPTKAGLDYPPSLLTALTDRQGLQYEPEPLGVPAARAALARWYREQGRRCTEERVMLTASSSESYGYLFHLLADPGDDVLIPAPSYPLFSFLADLAGVRLKPYPLRYDGCWYLDPGEVEARLTERSRAILVVSPNNPTGSYLKSDEVRGLVGLAERHGLALISDEVFFEYPFGAPRGPSLSEQDGCLTFTLGGLSKLAALPQLKLGWILLNGPEAQVSAALSRLELIADTFLSVGTPVQLALPSLLEAAAQVRGQIRERTARNLAALQGGLAGSSGTVLQVEGGWYAAVQPPATRTEEEWALALLDRGLLVHPGHFFDFDREPYLVLSLLPHPRDFDAATALLRAELDSLADAQLFFF
jgi:aspartate/methionine/tyrosine aminotransferase